MPREDAVVVRDLLAAIRADILSEAVQLRPELRGVRRSTVKYRSCGAGLLDRRPGEDARVEQLAQPFGLGSDRPTGVVTGHRVSVVCRKCM